ncbi:hypothetical protein LCGC14_0542400 [marine sediment metagenome]|uniref:Uncharacterized protein n=1 Tax=marine sediment metagenome TaxID=412755 RepID=A0A0F9RSH6_9ZZZZ
MDMNEVKPITGFLNYAVTRDGRVWSKPRKDSLGRKCGNRWMTPIKNNDGYLRVGLYNERRRHNLFIHNLVLQAFGGPRPPNTECCLMDGNPANYHLDNLRWKTHKEIVQLMVKRGSHRSQHQRGEKQHPNYKLSDRERRLVFNIYRGGAHSLQNLADQFGVSSTLISVVVHDSRWAAK